MVVTRRRARESEISGTGLGEESVGSSKDAGQGRSARKASGEKKRDGDARKRARTHQEEDVAMTSSNDIASSIEDHSLSLAEIGIETSEELVRTLKTQARVSIGGKESIESVGVATIAWRDERISIPRKAELLLGWLIDELIKEVKAFERGQAGKAKDMEASTLVDARFWSLAATISKSGHIDESQRLLSKVALDSLLCATGVALVQRRDEEKTRIPRLTALLVPMSEFLAPKLRIHSAASSQSSTNVVLQGLCAWLQIASACSPAFAVAGQEGYNGSLIASLATLLQASAKAWHQQLSRPGALQKSRDVFASSVLEVLANLIVSLDISPGSSPAREEYLDMLRLRASTLHVTFSCFFKDPTTTSEASQSLLAGIKHLKDSATKWRILPVLLAQRCLSLKQILDEKTISLQQQAAERQKAAVDTAGPFVNLLASESENVATDDVIRLNSLNKALDLLDTFSIDIGKESLCEGNGTTNNAFEVALSYSVQSLIQAQREDGQLDLLDAAVRCIRSIHKLDQAAVSPNDWTHIAAVLLLKKATPSSCALLRSACESAVRRRSLDVMIRWLFDAVQEASSADITTSNNFDTQSVIFGYQMWADHLGAALGSFVSDKQAISILDDVKARLRNPILQWQKGKEQKATSFACVKTHELASLVITYLALPSPVLQEAVATMQQIFDDTFLNFVNLADTAIGNEWMSLATAAAVRFSGAIASRGRSLGAEGVTLSRHIESVQDGQFESFKKVILSNKGCKTLRLALHLETLDRIARDDTSQRHSRFRRLLEEEKYYSDFLRPIKAGTPRKDELSFNLWKVIGSKYLSVFEKYASNVMLDQMANAALEVFLAGEARSDSGKSEAAEALFGNAANLELTKWQQAISHGIITRKEEDVLLLLMKALPHTQLSVSSELGPDVVRKVFRAVIDALGDSHRRERASSEQIVLWLCKQLSTASSNLTLSSDILGDFRRLLSAASGDDYLPLHGTLTETLLRYITKYSSAADSLVVLNFLKECKPSILQERENRSLIISLRTSVGLSEPEDLAIIPETATASKASTFRLLREKDLQAAIDRIVQPNFIDQIHTSTHDSDEDIALYCAEIMQCLEQAAQSRLVSGNQSPLVLATELATKTISDGRVHLHLLAGSLAHISMRSRLEEYTSMLHVLIRRAISKDTAMLDLWRAQLQVLCLILCNGPEGSLPAAQAAALRLFAALPAVYAEAGSHEAYAVSIADAIEVLVSGRALLFKQREVGACLCVVTTLLSARPNVPIASGEHAANIFASLTTSITNLIVLRPEALSALLPQLTVVLTQLVGLFREPMAHGRPIARQQSEITAFSPLLPPWLNIRRQPLDVSQARQVSRLCSAMTARTTIKARNTSAASRHDDRKKRTIAKPFSNHAVYLLLAYIRSLTKLDEVVTGMSPSGRQDGAASTGRTLLETIYARGETGQELTRAMYSICDVVSTHQRNLLMDLLADDGERVVARQLLRGHESQRYKGG